MSSTGRKCRKCGKPASFPRRSTSGKLGWFCKQHTPSGAVRANDVPRRKAVTKKRPDLNRVRDGWKCEEWDRLHAARIEAEMHRVQADLERLRRAGRAD